MIDTFWAVWLPAGANAFNVIIIKRFFDNLPREIFEAARVDGAGPFRLFWSIVLPMSRPIIGVVSVFAVIGTWKDYLWPLLVLRNPDIQPLSVRLPTLQPATELDIFLAALAIATLIPIALFLSSSGCSCGGGASAARSRAEPAKRGGRRSRQARTFRSVIGIAPIERGSRADPSESTHGQACKGGLIHYEFVRAGERGAHRPTRHPVIGSLIEMDLSERGGAARMDRAQRG